MDYVLLILVLIGFFLAWYFFRQMQIREKEAQKLRFENLDLSSKWLQEDEKRQTAEDKILSIEQQYSRVQSEQQSQIVKMERFRLLLEDTGAYLCELDYLGEILYANPAALNKLGYSEEEIKRFNILDFSPHDQKQKILKFYENQYRLKKADTYSEWEVTNRFGEIFRIGCRVKMEFYADGKIETVKAISHDLSVLNSNDKMQNFRDMEQILARYPFALLWFQRPEKSTELTDFRLKWASKVTLTLMNFDWFEVENVTLPDVSESLMKMVQEKMLWPDKEITWFSNKHAGRSFIPVVVFYENHLFISLNENTAAQKTLNRTEQERDFFKSIVDQSKLDVAVFSPDQVYLYVNQAAVKDPQMREWIIGKTDEEYCKLRFKSLSTALIRKSRLDEIRGHKKNIRYEDICLDQDKNIRYFIRELSPCLSESNNLQYFVVFGHNLTDRYKRLEHQMEISDKWSFISRFEELHLLESKPSEAMNEAEKKLLKILGEYFRLRETSQLHLFSKSSKLSAFYLYPMHLSHIRDFIFNFEKKWTGLRFRFNLIEDDFSVFLLPKILMQETLERLSELSFPYVTDVQFYNEKDETGKDFLVLRLQKAEWMQANQATWHLIIMFRIWMEEGFYASLSEEGLKLALPLIKSVNELSEDVAQSLQILQKTKILLGPAVQNPVERLSEKLQDHGAEVVMVQNPQGVNRYLSQGSLSIVVWWGNKYSELEGLDWQLANNQNIRVLFLNQQPNQAHENPIPNPALIPFQVSDSVMEIMEQIWLLAKSEQKQPLPQIEKSDLKLSFSQLAEITEGDKNFIATLVKTYFNSLKDCRSQFEGLLEQENAEGMRFLLHKIRATTKTFGIRSLDDAIRNAILNMEANNRITKKMKKEWIQHVNQICEEAGQQIQEYCRQENIPVD